MAIQIADGFQLRVAKPLDDRQNVETVAQLDPTYGYEGQIVYVKDIKQFYTCYKDDNGSLAYKVMETGNGGGTVYTNTPIGTVLSFAGLNPPNGYLLCDGGSYVVTDYQDLYDVIGNTYGGDSANFNVPNLIDKFIQGSNTSGTEKEAGLPNITGRAGYFSSMCLWDGKQNGAFKKYNAIHDKQIDNVATQGTSSSYYFDFDASLSNSIYGNSNTVQPPALTMVYIIKAFHTNEGVDSSVELEDNVVNHINNRIENKVNEVVKKTDIATTIDLSSTYEQVASAKAVYDELQEVFQSVSSGKELIANAITDKGVNTAIDAEFATMASNISKITTTTYKEETKSYNNTSSSTNRLVFTFSADVSGVKQITPPSNNSPYIVPETSTSMFTINGKELILYVNGSGTWKVTAIVKQ